MDIKKISEEYKTDKDAIQNIIDTFDEKESMLISKVEDSMSFKSKVTDSRLSTIIWERAGRVMGQLPSGMVKALSVKDKGKSTLMDIILGLIKPDVGDILFDNININDLKKLNFILHLNKKIHNYIYNGYFIQMYIV